MIPESWMKGPLMWSALLLMLLAILLAFVWDLATDQAEQRVRSEQSTQHHIEYAEDRIDDKCLGLEFIPMRDCIHKEIESARDHDRANQDLNAQQQMAFFTKIMGATAVVGLALGVVSIGVIFATLREMGNTNRIMRDEQRPWLVIDQKSVPYKILSRAFRSQPSKKLTIKVTNKGKLPARNATATYVTYSADTVTAEQASRQADIALFESSQCGATETNTVFQGETASLTISPLPPGQRVIGNGRQWSLMVNCTYFWEEELKSVWMVIDVERPPENTLKG